MMGYFKPLRRKIGVMTLMVACVFTGGWVRSLYVNDVFIRTDQTRTVVVVFVSAGGYVLWQQPPDSTRLSGYPRRFPQPVGSPVLKLGDKLVADNEGQGQWITQTCGFGIFDDKAGGRNFYIPYALLVIPLAAFSTLLLLSKPKQPKPTTEPAM